MARNSRTHGINGRLMGGRMVLASAALATFTMFGGAAFADELPTDALQGASDGIVLEAPATSTTPTLLRRENEQRGNDDGARHARHGADDGAGDDHGKDRRTARHGADDQPGDDRGGHGKDDGPNHA